ncbi:outer membrane lipoprotein chaperone LolA [Halomonas denitrificans]|uniref:outer membrane lipoprotein chaperone LolA n=1 Tax=Halomonas TaxID=2745 RepID=UPI001A8C93DD|nr:MULTISPECIES: outer membrane lipoprotein chaperone LolA [Halomonas]MED5293919.1 outer membrane lipoprotein chaperone LolA [Pseudomonadota bacterium]MBN8414143.1 outer membrane lipoprotein chaperone LolA [Halomonas litopenaei]MBY5927165.1 outer membrane lipoprotein chaperone LolA [Halomonas sp. DP4Y7-2]MBY5930840.1 outer membrane lipoprotein chaperone LolA [Halomonas sp. DP8Y7-3]MBY5970416.1 outer membrane lipoprotein chaperone LolA [Halomonas denitrificans]
MPARLTLTSGLATLALALAVPATALADGAERLTRMLEPLNTYSADFEQQILDGSGQRLQRTEGHMWLSRPGKFRWEVEAPYEQVVVSDGSEVTLFDPDLQQATIQALDERVTHTPALLLSGSASELTDSYNVSSSQQGTSETFTLEPKAADTLFESLRLTFYSEELAALEMTDSTGQRTAIAFDNAEQNGQIDDGRYQFDIPEGTDVIRQTP